MWCIIIMIMTIIIIWLILIITIKTMIIVINYSDGVVRIYYLEIVEKINIPTFHFHIHVVPNSLTETLTNLPINVFLRPLAV